MTDSNVLQWTFRWLCFLVILFTLIVLLSTPKVFAHSYTFAGILADNGTITGAFAYNETAGPIATNVRGLSPNSIYGVTSSAFTINTVNHGPTVQSTISEFCFGNCIFGGPTVTALTIDGLNSNLRLSWLGQGFESFNSGWLRTWNADGSFNSLIGVRSQTMTQIAGGIGGTGSGMTTVPEIGSFWSMILGLAGIGVYLRWR